jgi:hypothetical protein
VGNDPGSAHSSLETVGLLYETAGITHLRGYFMKAGSLKPLFQRPFTVSSDGENFGISNEPFKDLTGSKIPVGEYHNYKIKHLALVLRKRSL